LITTLGAGVATSRLTPDKVPGSTLTIWSRADTTVQTGGARQFTAANLESLSIADDPDYDLGIADFLINAHVYRDAASVVHSIASKYQDADNYWLWDILATGELHFIARGGGSTIVEVTGVAQLAAGQYYGVALAVDRDAAANTKFYVDSVADVSGTPTVGVTTLDNSGPFAIGAAWAP